MLDSSVCSAGRYGLCGRDARYQRSMRQRRTHRPKRACARADDGMGRTAAWSPTGVGRAGTCWHRMHTRCAHLVRRLPPQHFGCRCCRGVPTLLPPRRAHVCARTCPRLRLGLGRVLAGRRSCCNHSLQNAATAVPCSGCASARRRTASAWLRLPHAAVMACPLMMPHHGMVGMTSLFLVSMLPLRRFSVMCRSVLSQGQ